MIKQVLVKKSLNNPDIPIDQLSLLLSLIDQTAFMTAAYDFWFHSQKQSLPLLSDLPTNRLLNGTLNDSEKNDSQPVLFHHINQRLIAEQAQLHVIVVGLNKGRLSDIPFLQLNKSRTEFLDVLTWAKKIKALDSSVHWVEKPTNQLWQHWQENALNVMSVVAPATRCWYQNKLTTPVSIVKKLDFYALNHTKMPLPYQHVASLKRAEQSFWYAQVPIELRGRGGRVINTQLYALKLINSKNLTELKTYYIFVSLNKELDASPEQMAIWLLQHLESKNLLRYVSRAYHHKTLQHFIKRHQLNPEMALKLAGLFGGAAWELEQYATLRPVNQLLLALSGKNALNPSQITSSLLKLFKLKQQITH